jgi:uncharacterized tellurite resistance protein B-like protein
MTPMQLSELSSDEKLALVSLTRVIARADGAVSPAEGKAIKRIALAIGEATFRDLFAEAAELFPDESQLRPFLATIERQEARALIFQTIVDLAASDAISTEEGPLMAWLEETWAI